MRHLRNLFIAFTIILAVAFAYSMVVISRRSRRLASYESEQAQNEKSIHQLQGALREEHAEKARIEVVCRSSQEKLQATLAQSQKVLQSSLRQLSAAEAQTSDLRLELSDSKRKYQAALANANDQIRDQKTQIQAQLAFFKKQMGSAQAEIQASRLRVEAVERVNAKLRKVQSARSAQTDELAGTLRQLQDLERRREVYVTSIMSHYRALSNQLESMTGMLDANRDANANALSNQALYHIRDALSRVSNDLRELNSMNGEIRQAEKKITGN
jgi:chromosome segregation ATPase